jgi:hypothetical protein
MAATGIGKTYAETYVVLGNGGMEDGISGDG